MRKYATKNIFLREMILPAFFVAVAAAMLPAASRAQSPDASPTDLPAAAADLPPPTQSSPEPGGEKDVLVIEPEPVRETIVPEPFGAALPAAASPSPAVTPIVAAPEPPTRNARLVDAIVASVDGVPVTYLDLQGFSKGRGLLTPGAERMTEAQFLDVMVEERLFEAEFELNDIVADDEDTQAYIDRILEANKSNQQAVEIALAEIGLQWNDYFSRMRFEVQKLALINREVRTRANVTDEDVERHWKTAPEYQLRPRVAISHIYVPLPANGNILETTAAEEQAQSAYEMAKKSGFSKAATKYSEGPTAADGGKLGEFEYGTLAPHFSEQIAVLEEGEHSEPFTADGAIHIIRVDEVLSEGRVELVEVQEEIRGKLYNELLDVRFQRWLDEDLYKRHHVAKQLGELNELVGTPSSQS